MAESIGGALPTQIPSLTDAADIQNALRVFHYGSLDIPTYVGNITSISISNVAGNGSIAGYIKGLQLQLDQKSNLASPTFSGTVNVPTLTASANVNANIVTANVVNTVNVISTSNILAASANATNIYTTYIGASIANATNVNANLVSANNIISNANVNAIYVNTSNVVTNYSFANITSSPAIGTDNITVTANVNTANVNATSINTANITGTTANIANITANVITANVITANITGNLTGIASTAISAGQVNTISNATTNATFYPTFVDSNNTASTAEIVYTDNGLRYNPSTNTLTATAFTGRLNGTASYAYGAGTADATMVVEDTTSTLVYPTFAWRNNVGTADYELLYTNMVLNYEPATNTLSSTNFMASNIYTAATFTVGDIAGGIIANLAANTITLYSPTTYLTHNVGDNSQKLATTEYVDRGYRYLGTIQYTSNTTVNLIGTVYGLSVRAIGLRLLGAGGGGGGCADGANATGGIGGAGGGGGYRKSVITPITSLTGLLTVNIGTGGAGGVNAAAGSNGTTTNVLNSASTILYFSANGGSGGNGTSASSSFPQISIPGAGAAISNGGTLSTLFQATGQSGGTGSMSDAKLALGGAGGENHLYRSYYTTSKALTATANGFTAGANLATYAEYGIGGTGGAVISGAGSGATGGSGAQGIAFIDFYA